MRHHGCTRRAYNKLYGEKTRFKATNIDSEVEDDEEIIEILAHVKIRQ